MLMSAFLKDVFQQNIVILNSYLNLILRLSTFQLIIKIDYIGYQLVYQYSYQ